MNKKIVNIKVIQKIENKNYFMKLIIKQVKNKKEF